MWRRAGFAAALGAVAFLVADAVEARYWRWFAGQSPFTAWFLNSGRAIVVTGLCVFAGAAVAAAQVRGPGGKAMQGACAAIGACDAMAIVLFVRGPGTMFPIVLAVGASVLFIAAAAGAFASFLVRR